MKIISNFYQGTIKFVNNDVRYEVHYSYIKNQDTLGEIKIDMAYINDKDFTEELEQLIDITGIINLIKQNL